jgi:hypothetical protein
MGGGESPVSRRDMLGWDCVFWRRERESESSTRGRLQFESEEVVIRGPSQFRGSPSVFFSLFSALGGAADILFSALGGGGAVSVLLGGEGLENLAGAGGTVTLFEPGRDGAGLLTLVPRGRIVFTLTFGGIVSTNAVCRDGVTTGIWL